MTYFAFAESLPLYPGSRCLVFRLLAVIALFAPIALGSPSSAAAERTAPVVVYGADSAGTGAAFASARLGRPTILIAEGQWLGGMMTSGGIGVFDGNPLGHSYGLSCGLFGELKLRLARLYPQHGGEIRNAYRYEPAVGARVLEEMASELPALTILRDTRLVSAQVEGDRVVSLTLEGGFRGTVRGEVFIDGTDTGLLAARAGVPYRLGTDDRDGIVMAYAVRGTFQKGPGAINPFQRDPATGEELPPAYYSDSYRDCIEEIVWRWKQRQEMGGVPEAPGVFNAWGDLPVLDPRQAPAVRKWDINGDANDITLDQIAEQLAGDPEVGDYFRDEAGRPVARKACVDQVMDDPALSPERRAAIVAKIEGCVRASCLGVLYYIRQWLYVFGGDQWGLAPDYGTPDGLPPKVYYREGRRIVGCYTLTERDLCPTFDTDYTGGPKGTASSWAVPFDDAIAVGDYAIDFHKTSRETGNVWFSLKPYQVPYRILVPVNRSNLLVGSAVSATHGAYGTLRMDPLRMLMGQACGTAAHLALRRRCERMESVPIPELQELLIAQGVMLSYFEDIPYDPQSGGMTLTDLFIPTQVLALRADLRGFPDRTFRRHDLLTRAQFARLLALSAGLADGPTAPLPADVEPGSFSAREIELTLGAGALAVDAAGRFRPEEPITRGEAAWAVWLAAGSPVAQRSEARPYTDVNDALRPAVSALAGASRQDGAPVFGGVAPGLFAPDAPLTRAEAARLLQRALLPVRIPRLWR